MTFPQYFETDQAETERLAGAAPVGVEERFIPTWEQLEELWMNRMAYTSFVEKHEYELGFQTFKLRHEGHFDD